MSVLFSLQEIVSKLGGELQLGGDLPPSDESNNDDALRLAGHIAISRVSSLANAAPGHISFMTDTKYLPLLATTKASAVIVRPEHRLLTRLPCIVTDNPYAYFAKVSELLNPPQQYSPGVHVTAVVAASAVVPESCTVMANSVIGEHVRLGERVIIGPGCIVENNVAIDDGSHLESHVVIYHDCTIGKRCTLAAGTVIGADGFGFANDEGRWVKIPQIGRVIIQDDVAIGANTTIDRGALDDTVIEEGVKLDNLIQIGHNCRIGAHTVIAGCVGIAGSAVIGRHCKIGGAAMILGHLHIADEVTVSPGTMITRSLSKADTYTALMPFQAHKDWLRTAAQIRHMGDVAERLKSLESQLSILKSEQNKS